MTKDKILVEATQTAYLDSAVDKPVFIVGTMRSGTSFLGLALNQIETFVGCPFELRQVWSNAGRVPMASDVIDSECPCLTESDVWPGQLQSLREAFKLRMLDNIGDKQLGSNSRFLNKCPHLCNKLGLVKSLFPKAGYIWTLRNLEEVVVSLKNLFLRPYFMEQDCFHYWQPKEKSTSRGGASRARCFAVRKEQDINAHHVKRFFPGGDVEFLAEYWLESNLAVMDFFQKQSPEHTSVVIHHDVIANPKKVASRLERIFELDEGECRYIVRDSTKDKVGGWSESLDTVETSQLHKFSERNHSAISKIWKYAESRCC